MCISLLQAPNRDQNIRVCRQGWPTPLTLPRGRGSPGRSCHLPWVPLTADLPAASQRRARPVHPASCHPRPPIHMASFNPQVLFSSSVQLGSVQLLSRVSLWPHGLQHTRPPCSSPTPRVYSNSCPLSWWYHPAISFSVVPFSSCLQSFSASGSFQTSPFFTSDGQSIGVSASASVFPMNSGLISFRIDWLDLLAVQGTLKSLFQHYSSKASVLQRSAVFIGQLSHPYMTTGKTIALTRRIFVGKVMSLLFNMLSGLVITFLLRSKCLLISWLQSPSAVILEPRKIKSVTVSPSICHEVMGPDAMILVFWMLSFKPTFYSLLLLSSRGSLILLHFLP